MLIIMGIFNIDTDIIPIIQDENNSLIIKTAFEIASLHKNLLIMKTANNEISKAVFSLKSYARQNPSDKMDKIDIRKTIEIVLILYLNKFKNGVEVIKYYDDVPSILCYENEITQVWSNLIQNSLQAMEYKGKLYISIRSDNNNIIVSITDTGKGINPEIKDKIFEPFFTTKPSEEGSGIGLDTVKKIVNKHHGKIQ